MFNSCLNSLLRFPNVQHCKPAIRSYSIIFAAKRLSNLLNRITQIPLTKVLKPVDRQMLFALS